MRIFHLILLVFISFNCFGQFQAENGMSGKAVREGWNSNFDALFNLNKAYINVKDFGAEGDGVTDDRDAFNLAVEYAKDKDAEIVIPSGTYRLDGVIEAMFTAAFKMRGIGNAVLDWSDFEPPELNSNYFDIKFDTIALGSLLADAIEGDRYLSIATDLLSINDYFYLIDTDDWVSGFCDKGEIVQVKNIVDGTEVEIYEGLFDSYTASSTTAFKTSSGRSYIKNIKIIAPTFFDPDANRVRFINLNGFNNLTIEDVTIENAVYHNLSINYSRNVTINNYNSTRALRTGFGYDLVIGASQDITITNCKLKGARHGLTTGGYFPVRMMTVSNNVFGSANGWPYAFDTHSGAEHITFQNNMLYGGIQVRSPNTKILDNHIIMDDSTATIGIFYSVQHYGKIGDYFIASGNTIERTNDSEGGVGIDIYFQADSDTLTDVVISDNIISNVRSGVFVSGITVSGSTYIEKLQMLDNSITCSGGGHPLIIGSDINIGDLKIIGGYYYDESDSPIGIVFENKYIANVEIKDVGVKSTTTNIHFDADDIDNVIIEGCKFNLNAFSDNGSVLLRNTGMAVIHDNNFFDTGKSLDIRTNDTVYVYNNNYSLTGDSIYSTASTVYYRPRNSKMSIDMITDFVPYDGVGDSIHIRRDPVMHLPFLDTDIPAGDTLVIRLYFNSPAAGTRHTGAAEITSHFQRTSGNTSYYASNKFYTLFSRYTSTIENLRIINTVLGYSVVPSPSTSTTTYDNLNYVDLEIKNNDSVAVNWNGTISNYYNLTDVSYYLK